MKVLENAMGVKLFERGRNGMLLTRAGFELQGFHAALCGAVSDFELRLHAAGGALAGRLRVGTYDLLQPSLGFGFQEVFGGRYPLLSLEFAMASSTSLLVNCLDSDIDLAFVVEPERSRRLAVLAEWEDHYAFYVSAGSSSAYSNLHRDDLKEARIFHFGDSLAGHGQTLREHASASGIEFNPKYHVHGMTDALHAALLGHGIGLLPTHVGRPFQSVLMEIPVKGLVRKRLGRHRLQLLCNRSRVNNPKITAFQQVFVEMIVK